jgi:hypothetical protein
MSTLVAVLGTGHIARETVFDVLTRFVPALALRRAGYIDDRHEPTLFALRDLRKDLDLALGVFHRVDAHVPMTALVRAWPMKFGPARRVSFLPCRHPTRRPAIPIHAAGPPAPPAWPDLESITNPSPALGPPRQQDLPT